MKMKKRMTTIFVGVLFLAGLSLLLYPFVSNEWNTYRQNRLLNSHSDVIAEKAAAGEISYEQEFDQAYAYNDALLPSVLPDSFAVAAERDSGKEGNGEDGGDDGDSAEAKAREQEAYEAYMSCLNPAGDGMMGSVEIPKINITLPIFHTTSEEVLQHAAGHLEGSSLPVGGESTHAVISAHRGLPSAALFTDLDKLKEGDHFLLHILDDTLSYEVDHIEVVEPTEVDGLNVVEGEDLVTLFTCTPYGVNSHRLMVRGHRVPYVEEELADEKLPLANMSLHTNYLLWVVVGLAVTGLFILFLYYREKKTRQSGGGPRNGMSMASDAGGIGTGSGSENGSIIGKRTGIGSGKGTGTGSGTTAGGQGPEDSV